MQVAAMTTPMMAGGMDSFMSPLCLIQYASPKKKRRKQNYARMIDEKLTMFSKRGELARPEVWKMRLQKPVQGVSMFGIAYLDGRDEWIDLHGHVNAAGHSVRPLKIVRESEDFFVPPPTTLVVKTIVGGGLLEEYNRKVAKMMMSSTTDGAHQQQHKGGGQPDNTTKKTLHQVLTSDRVISVNNQFSDVERMKKELKTAASV